MPSKASHFYKYLSLVVLVIQTTVFVLLLRYSRTVQTKGARYISSTAIVLSECLKLLTSILILYHQSSLSVSKLIVVLYTEVWKKGGETAKLIIPAFTYVIQNNLLFFALSNLDAATFQVTYQLKILITALFSVMMLDKKLKVGQWVSLVMLMLGVVLVQWPTEEEESVESKVSVTSRFFGLLAVLASCFSSGFSGVYFEKLVKCTSQSLWIRNIQLALFGVLIGSAAVVVGDTSKIRENGFFQGYDMLTWLIIILQTFGGLTVATVIKYADNILKGFATSISIVLSTICSYYLLGDFHPTSYFFMGSGIVIISSLLYSAL